MSERDTYQPGVPCWVDNLVPDPATAMAFYGELLGWEFDSPGPGDYYVAKLRGRDVAGVMRAPAGVSPGWNTYVSVASAEDTARGASRVVVDPTDALPAGRVAALEDPTGAVIGIWEPAQRLGCQTAWVNRHVESAPGEEKPDYEWRDLWGLADYAESTSP